MARFLLLRLCVRAAVVAILTTTSGAVGQAPASASDEHLVRTLFDEGVSFVDDERWEEAEDRFRRCLEIRTSPVIEYNLGSALEAQGEYVEAIALLRGVLGNGGLPAALRRATEARLVGMEPRVASMTIRLSGARAGAEVSIDGEPVSPDRIGVAFAIDPGRHQVVARGEGGDAFADVEAAEGESLTVQLALPIPTPVETARAEVASGEATPIEGPARIVRRRRWLWTSFGVAVAAGVVATVLLTVDRAEDPAIGSLPPGIVTITVGP